MPRRRALAELTLAMPGPGTREVGTPSGLCIRVQRLGFMPYPHNTIHHMWDGAHVLGACTPISSMTREHIAEPHVTLHTLHMHQDVAGVLMQSHTHTPRHTHTQLAAKPAQRPLNAHLHKQHPFLPPHARTLCTPTAAHVPGAQCCSQSQRPLSMLLAPPALGLPWVLLRC